MSRNWSCFLVLAIGVAGCIFNPAQVPSGSNPLQTLIDVISDDLGLSTQPAPADTAFVSVEIVNRAKRRAACEVLMRVVGRQVHFAQRRAPGGSTQVVVGPDRCDTVMVECSYPGDPATTLDPQVFQLGRDFEAGDVIHVEIDFPGEPNEPEPNIPIEPNEPAEPNEPVEPNEPGEPNEPVEPNQPIEPNEPVEPNQPAEPNEPAPPEPSVLVKDVDPARCVRAGELVDITVVTENASPGARIALFADPDEAPANGNEITIVAGAAAQAALALEWNTANVTAGRYRVYAELSDAVGLIRSAPAERVVRINVPPVLAFDSPRDGVLATIGKDLRITWAGVDDDDPNATLTLLLDPDPDADGDEVTLRDAILLNDAEDREFALDTSKLDEATFTIVGVISDCGGSLTVPGATFCTTRRLAGRIEEPALGAGEITRIRGVLTTDLFNAALGTAVDISRDLDGDRASDLLVTDPAGGFTMFDKSGAVDVVTGTAHLQLSSHGWPESLTTAEASGTLFGEFDRGGLGVGAAFIEIPDANAPGILLGAPQINDGIAYPLKGARLLDLLQKGFVHLGDLDQPHAARIEGESETGERAGAAVAAMPDVNDDGQADFAIGAPAWNGGTGRAAFVYGFNVEGLPEGDLGQLGEFPDGFGFTGEAAGDQLGAAIAYVGKVDGSQPFALLGAPGAGNSGGKAYLLRLDDVGGGFHDAAGAAVVTFVGEAQADLAGYAVAGLDHDGDARPDVAIGAPGAQGGRGRVYVIYNAALKDLEGVVSLADVGGAIAGAVLDGIQVGDQFGYALGSTRTANPAGPHDLLSGAPGAEGARGAAYLLFGGARLSGVLSAANVGTCDLPGWEFVAGAVGQRAGASVSGGDVNGDRGPDFAIGAPGTPNVSGAAFVLIGRPPALGEHDPDAHGEAEGSPGGSTTPIKLP